MDVQNATHQRVECNTRKALIPADGVTHDNRELLQVIHREAPTVLTIDTVEGTKKALTLMCRVVHNVPKPYNYGMKQPKKGVHGSNYHPYGPLC